ncbi:MAG: pilus assembly protein PilB, partial [Terriglobales bacterium]
MADRKPIFANGTVAQGQADEEARARDLARRYRSEFVDLRSFQIHHELFRSIPVDLMFRYNFVPLEQLEDGTL